MKSFIPNLCTLLLVLFSYSIALAQVPQRFNYQGIARDSKGNPMANQKMSLKISVLPTSDATNPEYEEIQSVLTNEFGLYTLQIGTGEALTGEMKTVKWETGNKYIKVAIDPKGGSDFVDAGTNQLLSVPYAIYADKAGVAKKSNDGDRAGTVSTSASGTGTVNYLTKFTAANTIFNSQLFDNGTSIGIGTASPSASSKLHLLTTTGNIEHIRMQNTNASGFGKFIMYNDNNSNYANFTKYGTAVTGGYTGISTLFPYANLFAFGNNNGGTLISNSGNVGINVVKSGSSYLKFFIDYSTLKLGLGGNAKPAADVHINSLTSTDTMKITNSVTGHAASDGLDILTNGTTASIINKENDILTFGTNNTERVRISNTGNVGIGTSAPSTKLEVAGQVKITGGAPGAGKVLTSDATGLATWQTPTGGGGSVASGNSIGDMMYWNGSNWIVLPVGVNGQTLTLVNGLPTWQGGVNGGMATVSTTSISSISNVSCTIGGDVTNNGGSTVMARGFVYNTSPTPTLANMFVQAGSGLGGFSSAINGLVPGTTYYIRAYATNSTGTNYGNQVTFNTTSNAPYTIGLPGPGNGYVFYDKGFYSNNWRYLEAAPYDQSTSISWGCNGTNLLNTNFYGVGDGFNNTSAILLGCTSTNIAAYLCDTLFLNGQSDWFLPSLDEIDLMHANLHVGNIGNFANAYYWTSSQNGNSLTAAYSFNFATGNNYYNESKNSLIRVRAIRRF